MSLQPYSQLLEEFNRQNRIQIWVPTLGKTLPFKHLSFDQHNQFLTMEVQHSTANLDVFTTAFEFVELLNKVIKENILETMCVDHDITVLDRAAIAIQLRVAAEDRFQVTKDKNTVETSLKNHVNFITTIGNTCFERNYTVTHGNISLKLDIPSLYVDSLVNRQVNAYDRESEQFPVLLFFAEIVKFIKEVSITQPNSQPLTYFLFEPDKFEESLTICRNLPITLQNDVMEYIRKVDVISGEITRFKCTIGETEESVLIPINTSWFTSV